MGQSSHVPAPSMTQGHESKVAFQVEKHKNEEIKRLYMYLSCLNVSHLGRLQGKMSPGGSNDPRGKCSPSHLQRARLTLLLPNSNTLKTGTSPRDVWSIIVHLLILILNNVIGLHTAAANAGGLAESGAVAVESWRAEPTGRKVLGPHNPAPGS